MILIELIHPVGILGTAAETSALRDQQELSGFTGKLLIVYTVITSATVIESKLTFLTVHNLKKKLNCFLFFLKGKHIE